MNFKDQKILTNEMSVLGGYLYNVIFPTKAEATRYTNSGNQNMPNKTKFSIINFILLT